MANFMDFHVANWMVHSVGSSSGIFVGENLQYGWRMSMKHNGSRGIVPGDYNRVFALKSEVSDPDLIDTWVVKAPPLANLAPPSPALAQYWATARRKSRGKSSAVTDAWDW